MSILGNMKTGNPAFTAVPGTVFQDWAAVDRRSTTMTVTGTATKALALLAVLAACAAVAWTQADKAMISRGMVGGAVIGGLVFAFATIFKPTWAPYTAPLYAACQGFFLGAVSNIINQQFPGIAIQAVGLTFGVMFLMLTIYATRIIRVTDQLTRAIVAATGAIALLYLVTMALGFFGIRVPFIFGAGPIGIAFSLFVVGLAAFNLLLDFDFIERQAAYGAPKRMEWYGAFGLMVTLIWLYLEILRLLMKLQSDRR